MSVKSARTSKELVEAARACLSEGNLAPAKAGDLLTSAVQQDPTFVNALVLRSNLASRLGQLTAATADLSLAIEVDRGSTDVRRVAALYGSRSSLLTRAGRHADAIADLRAALKCEPDNGVWAFELGRAYLREGRVSLAQLNFQLTLQEPMWSRVNESTRPKVYALYGKSCLMSRDYKKAKLLLRKALEVGGEGAAVLHDVGLAYYHEGTALTSALDFFARATEMDPQPVEYPMHLGLTHIRCGNDSDALSSMNEAVLRGREAALLRFYRGCIELQLNLGPQALVDLQAAADQHDGITTTTAAMAHGSAVRGRKPDDALDAATATAATSSSAPAWVAMALVHLFCEKSLEMAAACLTEALRRDMDGQQRTLAGLFLGMVLHQQGRTFDALRALSDVLTATTAARRRRNTSSGGDKTSAAFDSQFDADMELLVLTHLGLVYAACDYPDLALRFFAQARQRSQQRGQAALHHSCLFREAVAQAQLRDDWGALLTLQSSTAKGAPSPPGGGRGKESRAFLSPASPGVTPAAVDLSGATLTSSTASGGGQAAKSHRKPPSTQRPPSTSGEREVSPSPPPLPSSSPCAAFLTLHQQSARETAHLSAVTLRRLGRLEEALPYATAAVEAQHESASRGAAAAATAAAHVPAYLYNRALLHFSLHHYTDAMTDVQACIDASSAGDRGQPPHASADPYYLRGCIAHATGSYADALDSLSTALAVDGTLRTSSVFSFSYGVLLAIAGQHEAAIDAFSAAIQHNCDPGRSEAPQRTGEPTVSAPTQCPAVYYHERAKVYQQMGRYAEALADYNCILPATAATARAPPSSPSQALNWNALVNRALTLKELQRYDEAAVDWDAALRLDQSGCLAQFTSQDVFEMPYLELCLPGNELYDIQM